MKGASSPDDTTAKLAEFLRSDVGAVLLAWKERIRALPESGVPSLATHGERVIESLARSLEGRSRGDETASEFPTEENFSAARAIAELALLAETIGQLQPASLNNMSRDALHRVLDRAIAHSLARDSEESDRLRKRLRLATDVTLVGSWELDPGGSGGVDPRSRELFGLAEGQPATAEALTSQLHPDDRERVRKGIASALASRRPFMDHCRTLRPDDGGYRWIAIAADAHPGPDAPSPRLLGIVHDITDRKRTEEEHARVVDELSRAVHISEMFIGILSHDLRNPLSAVLAGAHLLGREALDDQSRTGILSRVVSSGERMGRMIDQLLDFTRARLGDGIPLRRKRVDLAEVAQEVVEEGNASSPTSVLRLVARGDTAGAWDRDRLSQVLSNLVGNALQHGEPSSPVDIVVDGTEADRVELSIENKGLIPPELVPVIFNPFRGTLQKRGKSKGLGLGLYVARQISLAHGGELEVTSTPLATTFRLVLPRSAQGATRSKQDHVREEELAAFERMAAPLSTTAVTAELFGATSIEERAPTEHLDIVERYRTLLDTALHRKAYRGEGSGLAGDIRALAERLGELGAGPREVTAVHAEALRQAVRGVPAAKTVALLSEGRLLALELMGNLASYYRRRSRGPVRTTPGNRERS